MKTFVLRASTNSEWDAVDFCIVKVHDNILNLVEKVKEFKNQDFFGYISTGVGFYYSSFEMVNDSILQEARVLNKIEKGIKNACKLLSEDYDLTHVEISNFEWEQINMQDFLPENKMDCHTIDVEPGCVYFKCYGKYSGEEFFSEQIPVNILN